jgi:hypothetical protein
MPILLNKKNIQGLPVTVRVNYDFIKATTLTDFFFQGKKSILKCINTLILTFRFIEKSKISI